MCIRNRSSRLK